ncbi:MAG: hypothetical protein ACLP2P_02315 [Desulfobaccales bacterium]
MNPSLENEIRDKLASYLLEEISLEDFVDWFVPTSWNVAQCTNQNAINLVYEIELWLAEYSDGHWNEHELKNHLRQLVTNYRIDLEYGPIIVVNSNAQPLLFASFDI